MKNLIQSFLAIVFLATLFTACTNDDDNDTIVITVDDAAEYVAASLAIATYGAVDNMNYVSEQILDLLDCNEFESNTRTDTETSNNGNITASFSISESYSRTCSGGEEIITYNFNAAQTTTSDRLDTDHNIIGGWTIDGAESNSTVLTYNGSYSRGGMWTYKEQDNRVDNTTTSFIYNNVKANKEDGVIFEGASTFTITGTSTVYEPYDYAGDVVFKANNICIATFETGEQYEINLDTGDVKQI